MDISAALSAHFCTRFPALNAFYGVVSLFYSNRMRTDPLIAAGGGGRGAGGWISPLPCGRRKARPTPSHLRAHHGALGIDLVPGPRGDQSID